MKNLIFLIIIFMYTIHLSFADVLVYSENNKFGLKNNDETLITAPKYRKLVRLGSKAWIMQEGSKYGIITDDGDVIIKPIYNQAERVLGKFVKFRHGDMYGIFDEQGFEILPVKFSSIDLLYGGLFVTCKNYKYGITDLNGQIILDNIFDDIYMPEHNKLIIVYNNQIIEIERQNGTKLDQNEISTNLIDINSLDYSMNPLITTGYYGVTLTDYILKLISSISPAYEETIDELMYSNGADTVNIFIKFSWLPKFPFVYAKKYYKNILAPYSGPLSKLKKNLKSSENIISD